MLRPEGLHRTADNEKWCGVLRRRTHAVQVVEGQAGRFRQTRGPRLRPGYAIRPYRHPWQVEETTITLDTFILQTCRTSQRVRPKNDAKRAAVLDTKVDVRVTQFEALHEIFQLS